MGIFLTLFCNLKNDRLLFSFIIMSIKRDWVRKKKINLTFLRLFDNPLSKYLIFRIISCMQCLFWVIYQNWKRRLGLAFGAYFFHKNVSYLVLYQLAKFKYQTFFPSQDIKENVPLSSHLDNWHVISPNIYLQFIIIF